MEEMLFLGIKDLNMMFGGSAWFMLDVKIFFMTEKIIKTEDKLMQM
jgi:hypothetical protein